MRKIVPLIPYIAVAVGLYCLKSAWAALGMYHAGIVIALWLMPDVKPQDKTPAARRVWVWLVGCVFALGGIAMYLLWPVLSHGGTGITDRLAEFGVTRHTWPVLAVYFCIVNSILEEFFWRGRLMRYTIRPVADDFLFAGYHAFVMLAFASPVWAIPVIVAVAFAGWLWRVLRVTTGSLTASLITHIVADAGIAVAVWVRGFA
jgi:membrane protease YdiL (CAAX protease family)